MERLAAAFHRAAEGASLAVLHRGVTQSTRDAGLSKAGCGGRAAYEALLNRMSIAPRVLDQQRATRWTRGFTNPQSLFT